MKQQTQYFSTCSAALPAFLENPLAKQYSISQNFIVTGEIQVVKLLWLLKSSALCFNCLQNWNLKKIPLNFDMDAHLVKGYPLPGKQKVIVECVSHAVIGNINEYEWIVLINNVMNWKYKWSFWNKNEKIVH